MLTFLHFRSSVRAINYGKFRHSAFRFEILYLFSTSRDLSACGWRSLQLSAAEDCFG